MFDHILRDNSYKNKQKFALCYYTNTHQTREEIPGNHSNANSTNKKTSAIRKTTLSNQFDVRKLIMGGIPSRMTLTQKNIITINPDSSNRIQKRQSSLKKSNSIKINIESRTSDIKIKNNYYVDTEKSVDVMKKTASTTGGSKQFNITGSIQGGKFQEEGNEFYKEVFVGKI